MLIISRQQARAADPGFHEYRFKAGFIHRHKCSGSYYAVGYGESVAERGGEQGGRRAGECKARTLRNFLSLFQVKLVAEAQP